VLALAFPQFIQKPYDLGMPDKLDNGQTGWSPKAAPPLQQLPLRGLASVLTVLLSVLTAAIMSRIGLNELGGRSIPPSWSESSPMFWVDQVPLLFGLVSSPAVGPPG